jgi:hypothetical protein
MPNEQIFSYIMAITIYVQWCDDDDVRFVLDQNASLDIYSGSSLKQQSVLIRCNFAIEHEYLMEISEVC